MEVGAENVSQRCINHHREQGKGGGKRERKEAHQKQENIKEARERRRDW